MHSQHEAREKIFVLNLYLRKKANKPSFVRAKVEGSSGPLRASGSVMGGPVGCRCRTVTNSSPKPTKCAEGPHDYAEFLTRLAVRLGDAQLAGNGDLVRG